MKKSPRKVRDYERGHLRAAIPTSVGAAVRSARRMRRWTQQRLADRSGLSRKTVSRVELHGSPDADTLMRICGALELRLVGLVPAWDRPEDDVPSLDDPLFGYRIRRRRRELGIRLEDAAAAAGISIATLSRFERLGSASAALLTPVYADDPEGEVFLDNDGLARALGFEDTAALHAYCTKE